MQIVQIKNIYDEINYMNHILKSYSNKFIKFYQQKIFYSQYRCVCHYSSHTT